MRIYDVTYPLSGDLPMWPGDSKPKLAQQRFDSEGGSVHITHLDLSNHTGTHVDAPFHMLADGAKIDEIPLERWLGPARVITVDAPAIDADVLAELDLDGVRKVLFKTRNGDKMRRPGFDTDFVALEPSGARYLVERGVELVGIDYLSIEKYESTDFATHRTLMRAGVLIIEGLNLVEVPPGDYELLCFPILLANGDGAPARVALRELI